MVDNEHSSRTPRRDASSQSQHSPSSPDFSWFAGPTSFADSNRPNHIAAQDTDTASAARLAYRTPRMAAGRAHTNGLSQSQLETQLGNISLEERERWRPHARTLSEEDVSRHFDRSVYMPQQPDPVVPPAAFSSSAQNDLTSFATLAAQPAIFPHPWSSIGTRERSRPPPPDPVQHLREALSPELDRLSGAPRPASNPSTLNAASQNYLNQIRDRMSAALQSLDSDPVLNHIISSAANERDAVPGQNQTKLTLLSFTSNHLTPLFPNHPSYPRLDAHCAICQDPFNIDHTPILVVNIPGCVGHVFGYECLRRSIGSGLKNSNRCPLCRSAWFDMDRRGLVSLGAEWAGVEAREMGGDGAGRVV
ncbi:hypothetical protein CC86DRAFT_402784 [Ophiobolus disseminans]|uniref:RING-type domain-containing protein n=1 Tax=Ophiobolus disseminans TaxID=1469910 RepID=A0A6A7ADH0_9PLEO|nr:hypothetical protein CC86DRAFT_402784 [Ophiobolus disseminans]